MSRLLFAFLFFVHFAQAQTAPEPAHPVLKSALKKIADFNEKERKLELATGFPLGLHGEAEAKRRHDFFVGLEKEIRSIDTRQLGFTDEINAALLLYSFEDDISDYKYASYLNPILSEGGFHTNITSIASARINTLKDAEDYIAKLNDLPRYMEEHFSLMRKGLSLGIAQPYDVVKQFSNTYEVQIVTDPEASSFWKPFTKKPTTIPDADWQAIVKKGREAILSSVVVAYKNVKSFFENEYLAKAPKKPGAQFFPSGLAFYQERGKHFTTTDLSHDSIYNIGLKEVARIKLAMEEVKSQVGFQGDMKAFIQSLRTDPRFYPTSGEALLKEASFIAKKIDGKLPTLFGRLPRQPYGVEPVPAEIAPTYTAGRYSPAPIKSTRSGNYWVNLYNLRLKTSPIFAGTFMSMPLEKAGVCMRNPWAMT